MEEELKGGYREMNGERESDKEKEKEELEKIGSKEN